MHAFLQEIRFAFRQITKSPGFSITIILTLAIGIGANTAMFSIMDAVIFRPLAVPDLNRLVLVAERRGADALMPVAMGNFQDWQRQSQSFSGMAVQRGSALSLTGAGDPEHLEGTLSSANLFSLLRVEPWLGRTFLPGEDAPGRDQEVVLTYSFWQKHYGENRNIIGSSLNLDGRPYAIIGVMSQGFHYASTSDVFLPLALTAEEKADRNQHRYTVLARLRPGVSAPQAQAELQSIAARIATAHPASNLGWTTRVQLFADAVNGEFTPMYMRLLMGVGFFVLLIICANVSNLQFSRSLGRRSEIAIRTAMGAGRVRILRQLLTESVLLSLFGAVAGTLLARLQLHISLVTMPPRVARFMPGWSNIGLNGRALAYSLFLAIIAGVLAGLAPTFAAMRVGISEQLKAGGRSLTGDRKSHRLRNAFAVTQITLSVALVAGATLMATGMHSMLHVTERFAPRRLLTFNVDLPAARYTTPEQQKVFYDRTLQAIRAVPGVASADLTLALPYNNTGTWWQDIAIEHVPSLPGEFRSTQRLTVTPGYLAGMHIPLLRGRSLTESDGLNNTPVAVISQKLAQRYFPNHDPLGQKIRLGRDSDATPWITIVGVVDDVTLLWLDQTPQPAVYLSYAQFPASGTLFAVRTSTDPMSVAPAVRHVAAGVDPSLPLNNIESYEDYLRESLTGLSYVVVMFAVDAAIALLLSAIGVFGVMANAVAERTHEIGIRMALGAKPAQIRMLVLRRALILTSLGLAAGVPLAMGLARLVSSLVVGVSSTNVVIFSLTAFTVALAALLATLLPAQRAASIEPMSALRSE
jgi:putative ABC transport system permease protein